MELRKANRKQSKIRLLIQGPSGSGKTFSALLIAKGLAENKLTKVAVVDTEQGSADLYSDLGGYSVLRLEAPFTPEKFSDALLLCRRSKMDVVILDGISPEWEYLLDYVSSLAGNSFTAWAKATPRHNAFLDAILRSDCHVICTARSKTDYVLTEKNGKQVPEKVGMKAIQRDGIEYDFTTVIELDIKHNALVSKDRTGLFAERPPFRPTEETGKQILEWCLSGSPDVSLSDDEIRQKVSNCTGLNELTAIFNQCTVAQKTSLLPDFQAQKQFIVRSSQLTNQLLNQTIHKNGNATNTNQG